MLMLLLEGAYCASSAFVCNGDLQWVQASVSPLSCPVLGRYSGVPLPMNGDLQLSGVGICLVQ